MSENLIAALLKANPAEQDWFAKRRIPLTAFSECLPQMRWLYSHFENYNCYPTLVAFRKRFPAFDLPKGRPRIQAATQECLDSATYKKLSSIVEETRKDIDDGKSMSEVASRFREAASQTLILDTHSSELDYSSTDIPALYVERVRLRKSKSAWFDFAPWSSLNELVGFFEPGELEIIVSRTSIGKSWVAIDWANHLASKGMKILFVSKEMLNEQVAMRFEAHRFGLPYPRFRKGRLPVKDLARWYAERRKAEPYPITILGSEDPKLGGGLEPIEYAIDRHRPSVVFIDGAYLIRPKGVKFSNDVQRFAHISNSLKVMAKATRTVIVAVIQLNRESESNEGSTKASLKNVYGADAWSQDCDNLLALSGTRGSDTRVLSLLKGRESALGEFVISFKLDPPCFRERGAAVKDTDNVEFTVA